MAKPLHITIFYEIGTVVTAKAIQEQLNASPEASEIILHINSPGGSVYEGYTIYNLLKDTGKKITSKVEGICASIATLIALSGDEIIMLPFSQWMVHPPFAGLEGTADDFEQAAAHLRSIETTIASLYVEKTGKSMEEIITLMKEDRFLNAEETLKIGFATQIAEPLKAVAFYNPPKNNTNYIEMTEEQENSLAEKIASGIANAWKSIMGPGVIKNEGDPAPPAPVAASQALENGESLYFDGELKEGTAVFTDEAMGTPAEDGEYTLEDGRVVVVAGGAVQSIAAPEPENNAEELTKAQARISELEKENEELKTKASTTATELSNLKNKLKEVPGAKAKAATPPQAHSNDTEPGTGGKTEQSQAFNNAAEKLKAKYNRK